MKVVVVDTRKIVEFLQAREAYKKEQTEYNEACMLTSYGAMVKGTSAGTTLNRLIRARVMDNPKHKAALIQIVLQASFVCSQS